ncbi:MAG: hypothetical protein FJ147_28215 [Deltaproteobacteria bacterium]|nr:hypothetical protein [Deltaproteobacteria bacterium]
MTEKSELLVPTPIVETPVPEHPKGADPIGSEMRVNAPTLDSLPQLLANDKIPWIDKRRATKEFLRKEIILLKEQMDRAVKVEKTRLDLATEAEIGRLNTLFAFEALRTQATIQKLFQTLGMEVMENLEVFMIDYAKQTTRHKREIKQTKDIEGAMKKRLLDRTDKSFHHLLGTIEKIVDNLFAKIEVEQSKPKS